jgi:hypothetical protein
MGKAMGEAMGEAMSKATSEANLASPAPPFQFTSILSHKIELFEVRERKEEEALCRRRNSTVYVRDAGTSETSGEKGWKNVS